MTVAGEEITLSRSKKNDFMEAFARYIGGDAVMSGLDIFEELRYIIELLLAEYMFAYFFCKKEKRI